MKDRCEFQWFGQKWVCVRGVLEDSDDGGECDPAAKRITIDAEQDQEEFLTSLHHELTEGASFLIGCTYSRSYPDKQDMFIMSHSQMDLISSTIRGAYEYIKVQMTAEAPQKQKGARKRPASSSSKKVRKKKR